MKKAKEFIANLLSKLLMKLVGGLSDNLPPQVYLLLTKISPVFCIDTIPCRIHEGRWQMGFIRRNTGFFKGKLWVIGGRVMLGEDIKDAIPRHVRETLGLGMTFFPGLDWDIPAFVRQYYHTPGKPKIPPSSGVVPFRSLLPNWGHEPSKHSIASTYLILLEGGEVYLGTTQHGGQEASEFKWFFIDDLPPQNEFAYGGYYTVRMAVRYIVDHREHELPGQS